MTVPVILLIAAIAIYVCVAIIVSIFNVLGKAADAAEEAGASLDKATRAIGNSLMVKIGRGGDALNYYVPNNLEALHTQTSALVTALDAVKQWRPAVSPLPTLRREKAIEMISRRIGALGNVILRDEIESLLAGPFHSGVEQLQAIIYEHLKYPVVDPVEPSILNAPPQVEPVDVTIDLPTLELPYYQGRFQFLNRWVDAAHAKSRDAFSKAVKQRETLLAWHSEFHDDALKANAEARNRWEVAVKNQKKSFSALRASWEKDKAAYEAVVNKEKDFLDALILAYQEGTKEGVENYIDLAINELDLPKAIPRDRKLAFDTSNKILVVEHAFPDFRNLEILRIVALKRGMEKKPVIQKERKALVTNLQAALVLRLAKEIFVTDVQKRVDAIALNGFVDFIDVATGLPKRTYCAACFIKREQLDPLNLPQVEPVAAFRALGGAQAGEQFDLAPINPTLVLDSSDPRFIRPREVIDRIDKTSNLACMEWDDFEHLIRELFERAFLSAGGEVHVTQASRDQGVDAVVLDPDPLRGGKIIIQAKRYTNTVDLSAVRDLYGTVINEGATRGVLVTTSHFGPDSYSFASGKPITLMNGEQLLGLLQQHGYQFRINLEEAKRLQKQQH